MLRKHHDEARSAAISVLCDVASTSPKLERALLIDDLYGQLRVIIWAEQDAQNSISELLDAALANSSAPYWSGEIWKGLGGSETERELFEQVWQEGHVLAKNPKVRIAERLRNRTAWFQQASTPPWNTEDEGSGPPIVVFYSFKGGVGRSTALASFAIQRARIGERVAIIDFDLDAPGIGTLLAADNQGTIAPWGTVDYLLERSLGSNDLSDYFHVCRREQVTGQGEIFVMPAGRLDVNYLGKLARLDFEPQPNETHPVLLSLLQETSKAVEPDWILLDARTGLSEPAGLLLGGCAHLHVLVGTSSEQNWQGLRVVINRLGGDRVRAKKPQLECVLVHTLVPEDARVSAVSKSEFAERARDEFLDNYYAEDPADIGTDELWFVRDIESADAPHVPVHISYQPRLSYFNRVDDVADWLAGSPEYQALGERISSRFIISVESEE